jgi:cytochrome P450
MGWTLWCMAHHPEAQQKVIDELDSIFGGKYNFEMANLI